MHRAYSTASKVDKQLDEYTQDKINGHNPDERRKVDIWMYTIHRFRLRLIRRLAIVHTSCVWCVLPESYIANVWTESNCNRPQVRAIGHSAGEVSEVTGEAWILLLVHQYYLATKDRDVEMVSI